MAGTGQQSDGSVERGGSKGSSSLEKLLQQAWINSQIPKVQRRSISAPIVDVSVEKRAFSQPSAELLWGVVSGRAGDVDELAKTYFHKSRSETSAELLEKLAQPQLESFSDKTEVPQSSSWNSSMTSRGGSAGGSSDKSSSQDSRSPTYCAGESLLSDVQTPTTEGLFDGVDFDGVGSGYADLAAQSEPLANFFDDLLTDENLEGEKSLLQQTSAYHAMAKEIAELLDPNAATVDSGESEVVEGSQESYWANTEFSQLEDICEVEKSSAYQAMAKEIADLLSSEGNAESGEVSNDENSTSGDFWPTEDQTTLRLMEGYTRMLSKHIMDVNGVSSSDDVDYKSWITESDELIMDIDGAWAAYLEGLLAKASNSRSILDGSLLPCGKALALDFSQSCAVFPPCTSMTELLYRCALAVSQSNPRTARDYLAELRSRTSPHGDYMQRMGHYFLEALVAKLSGTGEELYTVITNNFPSASTMLKAFRQYVDYCPYIKISHFFSMKTILDAFEGAAHVHVIHYGILYGVEWPSLIQHLAMRPGGPPQFRMTGVDYPSPGDDPCRKIHETGRRLAEFAKRWGVPFEYHALAGEWESFTAKDFNLRDDEVLAVTSVKVHHISDESVVGASPRELLMRRIRSLNPKVFIFYVDNAACNAPLFMTRFRESVKLYTAMFNGFELSMPPDDPERVILEREMLGREILNVVACDGKARVERQEPYKQWKNRLLRAGFQQLVPKEIIYSKIKAMMNTFHKDYGVGRDEGWILLGIKNQVVKAFSAWEPKPVLGLIAS
ncbi:hypothetical protein KC19_7G099200 [Ceratodon purpureus]|uniref:Uncharacterized protein n=1 Tax=Ceratodon purpureus TaxID=3225 RepID=A0A8T0H9V3_CERPU|nr:hypothetical protein KC19_7G099200 [Ceratodon purpureus]